MFPLHKGSKRNALFEPAQLHFLELIAAMADIPEAGAHSVDIYSLGLVLFVLLNNNRANRSFATHER
jgi:hypothetical protein